jgi:phosphopantothenoylcysteine decarboxylase/phosphopantothenate--cysteine ligase
MSDKAKRRIVLGITGGIAAYKSADLVRRLRERGHAVRVVMTRAAQAFVTPLTLQAVSAQPVHTELLDPAAEAAMGHIELARWAELVLVAPASAHFIARLAHGFADDLLSTLCLATEAPLVLAPAMNLQMWQAQPTQANCALLERRGVRLLGPETGSQACGETGPGRMMEPVTIVERVEQLARPGCLTDVSVMVTAGPTREGIDPVRFISNRSSGKMGYAVARAAVEQGAHLVLISGPTHLEPPPGLERVTVESAKEMFDEVMARVHESEIFIGAAAVADYRPEGYFMEKIKKTLDHATLSLVRTRDILAEVASLPRAPFTVGFAAETENLEANALAKLRTKSVDMIAANRVGAVDVGFESDDNALALFWQGERVDLAKGSKLHVARELIAVVAERYHEKGTAQDSR